MHIWSVLKLPLHPSLTTTIIWPLNLQTSVGLSDDTKLALEWYTGKTMLQDLYSCPAGDHHNHGICEVTKSTTKLNFIKWNSNACCDQDNFPSTDILMDFLSFFSSFFLSFFPFLFTFLYFFLFSCFLFLLAFLFFIPFRFFLSPIFLLHFPFSLLSIFFFLIFLGFFPFLSVLFSFYLVSLYFSYFSLSLFLSFCIKREHLTHSYNRLSMHFPIIGN